MSLPASFHPAVQAWFTCKFGAPTEAQARGWAEIAQGHDTLIAAPTGSGKTLAAFLASLDALTHKLLAGSAPAENEGIEVVYVSPLKALSSDVRKNLEMPLEGIRASASELGFGSPAITTALRTGDSDTRARAAIVKKPPHILITTPESLYLMLTSERPRALLRSVRTVIVDELHALMRDKRGSHLALTLARLDAVVAEAHPGVRPQRVGLSATIHPIEDAARFLVGPNRASVIVDIGHERALDLAVEVPSTDLGAVATHEQWSEIYDRIAALIRAERTTLVFVNTRRTAERVALHLGERLGEECVAAHHGSLAKERRLALEGRLKAGDMKAIVATASLELGIDVGSVDLVCQIGSPRAMTTFLQRIGRSGHALGRVSKGRLFATSRDELAECAALIRGVSSGRLDRVEPPDAPIDILAQQIVAECAARDWKEDDLFDLVRSATPFATVTRERFDEIVRMLSEGAAPERRGRAGALLHHDRVNGVLRGRRAARITALTNGGAIPDVADYRVVLDPDETFVGTVNEDWAIESMAGDVFILGTHAWRIRRVESRRGVLRVTDATGVPPSLPFWLGEAPSRTWELSEEVSRLRVELAERLDMDAVSSKGGGRDGMETRAFAKRACALSDAGAAQLVDYIRAERDALGVIPTMTDVVFERFFDEAGGMQLVVHAPFGGRVNRAFGLALRKRFCKSFDFELQAAATDDAVILSMGTAHSFPLEEAFRFVRTDVLRKSLEQAILPAPMFGTRWRWNATRALAVLRFEHGKKVLPFLQRMRADDLMAAVFPAQVQCQENATGPIEIPDHPLVRQTVDDCLFEAMDLVRLADIIAKMERGEIRLHARDTTEPSPFTHEILNAKPYAFLDDAPLEERRARAVSLRRTLPEDQRDLGALDPEAIARVVLEAKPAPRDADELHDALLGLVAAPIDPDWEPWLDELVRTGRAATVGAPSGTLAFAVEHLRVVETLYPGHAVAPRISLPAKIDGPRPSLEEASFAAVRGHAEVVGPFTVELMAERLHIDVADVRIAAARLEGQGLALRGAFSSRTANEICDRRLLARIHRYTLDRLRSEIEPVSARDFMRFLFERHHLTQHTKMGGPSALRETIHMLSGYELPASAWETDVLARRVAGYKPEWLDKLCLTGEVVWARLSPRRSPLTTLGTTSRATPITLARREDLGWLLEAVRGNTTSGANPMEPGEEQSNDTRAEAASVLEALRRRGALFLHDLATVTKLDKQALADALWDLVGRGTVTGDGFQPLRDLMASGKAAKRSGRATQGRWSLLEDGLDGVSPSDELADKVAGQLLERYGIALRELYTHESFTVPWRDVARALRRREARGLVRGGLFVAGFIGEQYALADAVDALRRVRRRERTGEVVRISATDPLNLVGTILPEPAVKSPRGLELTFVDGAPSAPFGPGTPQATVVHVR